MITEDKTSIDKRISHYFITLLDGFVKSSLSAVFQKNPAKELRYRHNVFNVTAYA
jgi:hypothetical protein